MWRCIAYYRSCGDTTTMDKNYRPEAWPESYRSKDSGHKETMDNVFARRLDRKDDTRLVARAATYKTSK